MSAFKDTLKGINKASSIVNPVVAPLTTQEPVVTSINAPTPIETPTPPAISSTAVNQESIVKPYLDEYKMAESVYTDIQIGGFPDNSDLLKLLVEPRQKSKPKKRPEETKLKTIKLRISVSRILELLASLEARTQQEIIQELIIAYAQDSPYKEKLKRLLE